MPQSAQLKRMSQSRLLTTLATRAAGAAIEKSSGGLRVLIKPAVIAALASLFLKWLTTAKKPKRGTSAPGPPLGMFSLAGHGLTIYNRYNDLPQYYYETVQKYGKRIHYKVGPAGCPADNIVLVSEPDNVKHILKDNFDNYVKGEALIEWTYEMTGHGIFGVDGDAWYHQRKTTSLIFTSDNMRTEMTRCMLNGFPRLLQAFKDAGVGGTKPVDIEMLMMSFTLDTFCEIGFGVFPGSLSANPLPEWKAFAHSWDGLQALCPSRTFNPLWKVQRSLAKLAKKGLPVGFLCGPEIEIARMDRVVTTTIDGIIERRQRDGAKDRFGGATPKSSGGQSPKGESSPGGSPSSPSRGARRSSKYGDTKRLDLIELFSETTPPPTTEELRDVIKSLLLGGRDTTGATLTWTFFELARRPEIREKVRQEAEGIPKDDPVAFYNFVKGMRYTEAVIRETVRLHTPVAIDGKTSLSDDVLPDGTFIGKGWMVSYSPYVMARDTDLWGADALTYRPERWMEMKSEPSPYVYSQFQAGPRICLGKDLAILEAKGILALTVNAGVEMSLWPGIPEPKYKMAATVQVAPPGMIMSVKVPEATA